MKERLSALLLVPICGVAIAAPAAAQGEAATDVEEIVRRHIEARGGLDAIRAIENLVYSQGTYSEGDFTSSGDAFMAYKRPFYRLVGNPDRPAGFMEGYDGAAWEWYADPGVVLRTVGPASGAIRRGAVFEGSFVDYRERGTKIELVDSREPVEVDRRPTILLRVTSRDGFATDTFLDAESYLVVAARISAPIHAFGPAVTSESRFGDYRSVAGVLFPHHDVSVDVETGAPISEMRWGSIEANRELPVHWFSPPEFERTPLQTFIEQLFLQRSDAQALLWTYHDYRAFFPELDTRRGVEFIGYHMLKMGNARQAIPLLQANAEDHPQAARARFELGRAFETAGDREDARWNYEQALVLDGEYARALEALERLD